MSWAARARRHVYLKWGLPALSTLTPVWLKKSRFYVATIQGVLWWASLGVLMVSISVQVDASKINWWCAGGIMLSIALMLLRLSTVGIFSVLSSATQGRLEQVARARGWTLQPGRHTNLDYRLMALVTSEVDQVASRALRLDARLRPVQELEKPPGPERPRL